MPLSFSAIPAIAAPPGTLRDRSSLLFPGDSRRAGKRWQGWRFVQRLDAPGCVSPRTATGRAHTVARRHGMKPFRSPGEIGASYFLRFCLREALASLRRFFFFCPDRRWLDGASAGRADR